MEKDAATRATAGRGAAKAVGKLMSDKPGYVTGMEVALKRAWCPLSRLEVREMGGTYSYFCFSRRKGRERR